MALMDFKTHLCCFHHFFKAVGSFFFFLTIYLHIFETKILTSIRITSEMLLLLLYKQEVNS